MYRKCGRPKSNLIGHWLKLVWKWPMANCYFAHCFNSEFELKPLSCSRDMDLQKFILFSSYFSSPFFRNSFWNHYNSHILTWIALKFGALLNHFTTYLRFNFCSNRIEKSLAIWKFSKCYLLSHLQIKFLQLGFLKGILSHFTIFIPKTSVLPDFLAQIFLLYIDTRGRST